MLFPSENPSASQSLFLGKAEQKAELELPWAASLSLAGLPFCSVCTTHSTTEATKVTL